jgi:magnesium-protoporphyrin O-methyltransferase
MIHYPQDRVDAMIDHLASLAEQRLIVSFAPKTLAYLVLKRIGELFPGPSKVGGKRKRVGGVLPISWQGN